MDSKKNKDIRSRKKDNRKDIKIKKVNMSDVRKTLSSKLGNNDDSSRPRANKDTVNNLESTTKLTKYNSIASGESKSTKKEKAKNNDKGIVSNKKNSGIFGKFNNGNKKDFFFFKLSKIGQIMLVIYAVGILVFGFLFARAFMNKGQVILGNREEVTKVISNDQVSKIKEKLTADIPADNISVSLNAYRLVVVLDLKDSTSVKKATAANEKAYKIVDGITPIKDYFSGSKELNNDLFIYAADVVPTDYDSNSKYIIETYKNSRMSKPATYNLLKYRDKDSYKEVLKSLEKAK
ncbi:hypothetical protein [Mycoplasma sp. P36-A1]|uniref:hypothetical protein n=1 Tax=Mycoplasma sp. P36-A1 TaxID=3252900 RepID=UPI003C2BC39C